MTPFARASFLVTLLMAATVAPALAQSTPAPAPPAVSPTIKAKVDAHRAAGVAHYEANNLAAAMAEYKKAYELVPAGEFLWAMAQIESARGDCAAANVLYRRYLATGLKPSAVKQVTGIIQECERTLAASGARPVPDQPSEPPREPERLEPQPLPAEPERRTVIRPWYTDTLGDALVGVGAVGLITGGTFLLLARADIARANSGGLGGVSQDEYDLLEIRAERRQLYGAIAGGVGAALVVGGVVRFMTGDRTETIEVKPSVAADGASVTLGLRF